MFPGRDADALSHRKFYAKNVAPSFEALISTFNLQEVLSMGWGGSGDQRTLGADEFYSSVSLDMN